MPLEPGTRLGLFEVVGPLGAGGMGEVYRARDTRLGREVALKVLPEAFARDPVRVGRFSREARMLASINHPSIAAIYGAEEDGGIRYLVLELVPGDTLAERMAGGAISLDESLSFARQIAEALEAAHERGVVHRDLKPSNIKVTPEGKIKVLDLGLAKMMEETSEEADLSNSPTLVQDQTRPGVILGTAEFMSPEQARGKTIDKRTDIWAFGCILFEMLSGRRAFSGETVSDILAAILTREPEWPALPAHTPARIRDLLARCLQKDANQRLRDIGDARVEIERVQAGDIAPPRPQRPKWRLAAALLVILAAVLAGLLLRRGARVTNAPEGRSLVVLPARVLSDFPGGQLVGDGLVETLSVRLNEVPGIQVVTPVAAVQASDKTADPFGAARSVGAGLVVRSSVARDGSKVRFTYSVWNVQTRRQVAGDTVDGSASDLFGLQDELAERVALALKLPRPARTTPTSTGLETANQQERYVQALGHLQRYDKGASVDEAIRILETLQKEQPGSALVESALARGYLLKFNLTRERSWSDRALAAATRAQQQDPHLLDVYSVVGELGLRTGQPAKAVAEFQRVLAVQPNSFEALLGLARAYEASGDARQAEDSYRRAIALQPSYFGGHSKLGGFYFNQGRYPEAVKEFRRVTELAPDSARAFGNLGAAHEMAGDLEQAVAAYRKSLALEPTSLAYSNAGSAEYFLGHFRESALLHERAVQLAPQDYRAWANLAESYRWLKGEETKASHAYDQAISLCREELRGNSRDPSVHTTLGLCLAKVGKLDEATQQLQEALRLAPNDPQSLYNAAVVAHLQGRETDALDQLSKALAAGYPRLHARRDPELAGWRQDKKFATLVGESPKENP